jgi:Uri superfamily endonuclease
MGKITGFLEIEHHDRNYARAASCGRAAIELPAGRFLYCGSAKGQGGSKARLSRHFKSVRWHIDQGSA